MSTPPTAPTPTPAPTASTPSRRERVKAKFAGAFSKTTVYRDHSVRGFAIAAIIGAAAVLVTAAVLWGQAMTTEYSNFFVPKSTTTLAVSVLVQATVLFALNRVKPTGLQVVAILVLAFFMKFVLSYVAWNSGIARWLWDIALIGFIVAIASLILLYMLVFRLTAPKAHSPELVKAKQEYDAATQTCEAHDKTVSDLVVPVQTALRAKTDADTALVTATDDLKTLTNKKVNKKIRKDHKEFVDKDTTVATATTAAVKATENVSTAKTKLETATKAHKDAQKRQAELPGMITGREAELVAAQSELATANLIVSEKADLLNANPKDKAADSNYRRALATLEVKEKVIIGLEDVLAKLQSEELKSDNVTRTALGQKGAAERAVATNEDLEKKALKAVPKAETALEKKSKTGKKVMELDEKIAAQQEVIDKAKTAVKAADAANDLKVIESNNAATVLATSKVKEEEFKKAYDDLNKTSSESSKMHLLITVCLFVAMAGTSVAIWGYRLTQFAG